MVGVGEPVDPLGGGGEQDPVPGLAGADRDAGGQVGLPGSGRAEEDHVLFGGDEVQPAEVGDQVAFQAAGMVEVEVLEGLRAGNRAALIRPSPPWASRAATSRCRHAARNSSWVHASARARSASRPTASRRRRRLQRPGQEGEFAGHVPRRRCSWRPSRHPAVEWRAEGGVVVGEARAFHLAGWAGRTRSSRPPRSSFAATTWSRSVIVWCRAHTRVVVGDQLAVTPHLDPVQVGADQDPPADRGRVHRVVVAVQPHVVVPRQPRRRSPSRSPAAPVAAAASPPGRRRPGRPGRSPATVSGGCWPAPASR